MTSRSVHRGEVFLVSLGPTRGGEIRKMRPRVIVSPDELNVYLRTFIVAPLTTGGHPYPFRVPCRFGRRAGHVVLDQIRTVDRERLVRQPALAQPAVAPPVFVALYLNIQVAQRLSVAEIVAQILAAALAVDGFFRHVRSTANH